MQIQNNNVKLLNNFFWPAILFVLGMVMIINQSVGFDLAVMPGSLGDGRFNNYILEHGYQYLTTKGMSYWNAPFFFPEKDVISYSDNLFGTLPIYVLCRLWTDRETAYQLWYLILVSFNFIGAYYAIRKLNTTVYAASVGAFIYTFSLIILIQIGHIQLLPRFVAPVAIVSFYFWLQEKGNKHLYISLLLLTYQFYCAIYLGYFLAYVLIAMFVVYLIQQRKIDIIIALFDSKKHRMQTITFACVILSLLGILFYPYLLRSIDFGGYPPMYVLARHTPKLWTYFLAPRSSLAWGWTNPFVTNTFISDDSLRGEGFIFIGGLPYLLFIASCFMLRNDTRVRFFLIIAAALFIIILSVFDFSIYSYLVYLIPGARAIRIVSRYLVIALFLWSIISAFFLDHFLTRSNKLIPILIFVIPILLVLDNAFVSKRDRSMKSNFQKRYSVIVAQYEKQKHVNPNAKAFVINFNTDTLANDTIAQAFNSAIYHIDAMMVSQIIGLPCVNGYSAKAPIDYDGCLFSPDKESVDEWLHSNRIEKTVKENYTLNDILILEK